jgi:hypothetical protein
MSIPHQIITPIPNNEPDAVPALWNVRYSEIDANFGNLDDRQTASETELSDAKGTYLTLPIAIADINSRVTVIEDDFLGIDTLSIAQVRRSTKLDWDYRYDRINFEFFSPEYTLIDRTPIVVIAGVIGDDSIDMAETSSLIVGDYYVLSDAVDTVMIRISAILSSNRVRIATNLAKTWSNTATISLHNLVISNATASARIGAMWMSKTINIGNANGKAIIRHTANTAVVKLFYCAVSDMVWHEVVGTLKETGGNASISSIPNGFADYEYLIPTHENIKIRIQNTIAAVVIHHIVAIGLTQDTLGAGGVVLGNVDNTSDANKPVSTATQTALNLKANSATTYSKVEVDTKISTVGGTPSFSSITNKPTTIAGFGITDAMTATAISTAIANAVGSGGSGGGTSATFNFKVNFTGSNPTSLTNLPAGWASNIVGNLVTVTHTVGVNPKFISYLGYVASTNNWHYRIPTSGNEMTVDGANVSSKFSFTVNNSVVACDQGGFATVQVSFDDANVVGATAPTGVISNYQLKVNFTGSNPTSLTDLPNGWTYSINASDITIIHTASAIAKFVSYLGFTAVTNSYHYRTPSSANEMTVDGTTPTTKLTFRVNTAVAGCDNDGYSFINISF